MFTIITYPDCSPVTAIKGYHEIDARIEAVALSRTRGVRVAVRRAKRIHVVVGVCRILREPTAVVRCKKHSGLDDNNRTIVHFNYFTRAIFRLTCGIFCKYMRFTYLLTFLTT